MEFKTHYSERKVKPGETFELPSRTKQEPKSDCDINEIMRRYELTGQLDHVSRQAPVYADVAALGDFAEAMEKVNSAQAAFDALPSSLRKELDYNPANLVTYIQDPANQERCYEYGLLNKPVVEAPEAVVVDPAPLDSSSPS